MKAAQFDPTSKNVTINDIAKPSCGDNDLLVKIAAVSLCHSDLMLISGQVPPSSKDPITIGHEATGVVLEIGSNVQGFQVGDPVGFLNAYNACWSCRGCKGHFVLCNSDKVKLQGFTSDGFFQEVCAIDAATAVVIPKILEAESASPIFCAGITAYQAVQVANLQPGDVFGVIGCGGLGQLAIRYAKSMGLEVVGFDVDDEALKTAKLSGAHHVFNTRTNKDFAAQLAEATSGGCDAAAVFSAARAAYEGAPSLLKIGGTLVCVGIPPAEVSFNMFEITMQKFHIRAAGNSAPRELLQECVDFTAKHQIVSPQKYHQLSDINDMISIMHDGQQGGQRLVVRF